MALLDHYGEATAIAKELDEKGRGGDAAKMHDAMSNGSTGTEILMALRHSVEPLLKDPEIAPDMRDRLARLHSSLRRALE